jgi:hypothetical protein
MNRVLSWPHTPICPGLLDPLKAERRRAIVSERGMIRFLLPLGLVEMKISNPQHQLEPGTGVYVWWKCGGFVCAPITEVRAEETHAPDVVDQVMQVRSQLAAARKVRQVRLAPPVDVVPPEPADLLLHL